MSHQGTATLTVNGTTISWPVTIGGVTPTLRAVITPASQSVQPGAMVTLNGANSIGAKTYNWNQTSGIAVNLMGSTNAAANFVAPSTAGVLTFSLTVSDGTNSDTASTTVTVGSVSQVQA